MPECKKCYYFDNKQNQIYKNLVVVGFCNLREKFITDRSINNEKCSEKAIINPEKIKELQKKQEKVEYTFKVEERKKQFVTF